jgi:hypothetical protein
MPNLMTLQLGLRHWGCSQTRIEKEERHVLGMMPTLSLNQFMQILMVSITTGIHLMKKIYFRC